MLAPQSAITDQRLVDLEEICRMAPAKGHFAEIGVWKGGSAVHFYKIAQVQGRELHLFDTFKGMPYQDPGDLYAVGAFGDTNAEQVQSWMPDAHLHIGEFPASLPPKLKGFAFVHIDVDQYRSTRDAIQYMIPRCVLGAILAFDDYYTIPGVTRAIDEAFPDQLLFNRLNGYAYTVLD